MYTREIQECPETFVKNGHPVFGTFSGHSQRLDIRGVKRPYGDVLLPTFITNLRIKSRISFFFSVGQYIGCVEFFDAKILGYAEVVFWDKESKKRHIYHTVMGPRKRFVPHRLDVASTSCYKKSRYIRISWDRNADKLSVIFNIRPAHNKSGANAAFVCSFKDKDTLELTSIQPSPILRRCSARYYLSLKSHGALSVFSKDMQVKTMQDSDGMGFLDINRTYMTFRSHGEYITGMGEVKGEKISFRIESLSQEAVNTDKYNGNVLFYKGKATPLPPVVITHPYGIMDKWVIQDTENMIDLTFTPLSDNINNINVFFVKSEYISIYGTFDGVLLNADGEKINIRALEGITKKYIIRL